MNAIQANGVMNEILETWAKPTIEDQEMQGWLKALGEQEHDIAGRTLIHMRGELVMGNPRTFRPAVTEWISRYKMLAKAASRHPVIPMHECFGALVKVEDTDPADLVQWRPCDLCNPEGYERWRAGEFRVRINRPTELTADPKVGYGWLDKIRAERGMEPIKRESETVPPGPVIDTEEEF